MTTPIKLELVWAESGGTSDPTDAKYQLGWVSEIPTYQNFNYVLKALDSAKLTYAEKDVYPWQNKIAYSAGARVSRGGKIYSCITSHNDYNDSNPQDPELDGTLSYWVNGTTFSMTTDAFTNLNARDGVKIDRVNTRTNKNSWEGNDLTVSNLNAVLALNTTTETDDNFLFGNVGGKIVVVNVGNKVFADGTSLVPASNPNAFEVYHEGHKPTQSEVSGTIPSNPQDGVLYGRRNGNWEQVSPPIVPNQTELEIAMISINQKLSEGMLDTDETTPITKNIYSGTQQKIFKVPIEAQGGTLVSVSGNILTTTSDTFDLFELTTLTSRSVMTVFKLDEVDSSFGNMVAGKVDGIVSVTHVDGNVYETPDTGGKYRVSKINDGSNISLGGGLWANVYSKEGTLKSNWFGLTEGQDVTDLLDVLAVSKIKEDNITSFLLDVNVKYTGTLPYEYNQVNFGPSSLTGVGKLQIDTSTNTLQALPTIKSPFKTYSGKLNGSYLNNQNCRSAILVRKEIRVVLLGDSISVTSDWDSHGVLPGVRDAQGVDNLSVANAFGYQIFQELCAAVGPNVRVKLYSRSSGGRSYGQLNGAWDDPAVNANFSGREQATAGKAWVNTVLDLEPDLVIHSMGMNHGAQDYYNGYFDQWHLKLESTGRLGTFDQALVTTPSPNFEDAGAFGDFRPFCTPMFYVAMMQRYVAKKYGLTLIDVAFNSYLKRYGIDPRSCTFSKDAEEVLLKGAVSHLIPPAQSVSFAHSSKPIFHQTTFTINQDSGAALDFKVNFGGVLIQISQSAIYIYTGFFTHTTNVKSVAYAMTDNVDHIFTVQVTPNGVFLYSGSDGSNLILVNHDASYTSTVDGLFQNQSATGNISIKDVSVFCQEFPRYAADTATTEMYGVLDYTANPFGGGINHPSVHGLAEVYLPPMREFCNSLTDGDNSNYKLVPPETTMATNDLFYVGSMELIPNSVCEFWDDTTGAYIKFSVNGAGALSGIENRTSMTAYYNPEGKVFLKIDGGKIVKSLNYKGAWRKYGGVVVNSAFTENTLGSFTSIPKDVATVIQTAEKGIYTRYDEITVESGLVYSFLFPFAGNKFIKADATVAAKQGSPIGVFLQDKTQITLDDGYLHYSFEFSSDASSTARRILLETKWAAL